MVTGQPPPHSHSTNFNHKVNTRLFFVRNRLVAKLISVAQLFPSLLVPPITRKSNPIWGVLHLHPSAPLQRDRKRSHGTQTCLSRVSKKGQWHWQRPDCTCRARTTQEGCGRPAAPRNAEGTAGCTCARCQSSSSSLIRLCNRFEK